MNPTTSRPVAVRIFHPPATADAGPLGRRLADARADLGERHRTGFLAAGAIDAAIISLPPDSGPFGARLRAVAAAVVVAHRPDAGLVVLGSGAMALARPGDRRAFVDVAGGGGGAALANNRFSADAVAIAGVGSLATLPDLDSDNALPRWLAEVAGYAVSDLGRRPRLGVDLDSPLDLLIAGLAGPDDPDLAAAAGMLARVAEVAADRRAELVVAGRTSAASLAWLEQHVAARVRAFVEERGLRAASPLAWSTTGGAGREPGGGEPGGREPAFRRESTHRRPPASVLGALLDRDGPEALGPRLAELADAAIVDLRVLLAHRHGAAEAAWPAPEDRFAADLLLPDRIADPWLREIVTSVVTAPIPIALGGHTLVGPGLPLVLGPATRTGR